MDATKTRKMRWKSPESRARSIAAGTANLLAGNPKRHVTHGIESYLHSGNLDPEIAARVERTNRRLIKSLGGRRKITAQQEVMLSLRAAMQAVVELGTRYVLKHGVIDKSGNPLKLLNILLRYRKSISEVDALLGLDGLKKQGETLADILAEHEFAPQ